MASIDIRSGAKLEFRTSTIKKTTKFYKDYVAGNLTDENFKWPECPIKFITQNPLIGAINSPDVSSDELMENDNPESPGSSHVQQMPIFNDMAKRIKNDPEEKDVPKVEAPKYNVMVIPYGMAHGIPPMLQMAPPAQHPWVGGMTPAYNNPGATPMHWGGGMTMAYNNPAVTPMPWVGGMTPAYNNPAAMPMYARHDAPGPVKKPRAKIIPLVSHFDTNHRDPRPQPPSRPVPRKIITLQLPRMAARFTETNNRYRANGHRVAHSSRIDDELRNKLLQKQKHVKNILKNPMLAEDFNPNQLESLSDSDGETHSDILPPYETVQTNGAASSSTNDVSNLNAIGLNISSENDSDASRNTVELTSSNSQDEKEKSSRSSKKRTRSRSSHTKHDNYRSSDNHGRERSSSKHPRHDKERNFDHHKLPRRSDKRDRSRDGEKSDSEKKRIAPMLIDKRNNTVVSKGETVQDERSTAQIANQQKKKPATSTYVPRTNIDAEEFNLNDLFSPPRRITGAPFMALGDSFVPFPSPTPSHASSSMEPIGLTENDANSAPENNENATEHNECVDDGALDEMDTLVVSQSPTDMVDDVLHAVKLEEEVHFDDSSESVAGEPLMDSTMENITVPANTDCESNQVNPSSKSQCVLCTYHNDSAKKLVAHYVNKHPYNEVYVSRITKANYESVMHNTFMGVIADVGIMSNCPFCDVAMTMSAEKWVTHFAEHTGEFENRCIECEMSCSTKIHGKCNGTATISIAEHTMDNGLLRAYMCQYCYFTQLNKSRVEDHISNEHQILPCPSYQEFTLLRKLNALPAELEDSATQEVSRIARQLAQQNEIPGSIIDISDDSQDTQPVPNGERAGEATAEGAHSPTSTERPTSLETKHDENVAQSVTEPTQEDDATTENFTAEPKKADDNQGDEKAVEAEDDEMKNIPSGSKAPAAQTTLSPDSKTSYALLVAKEQMKSIDQEEMRPLEERLQDAKIDCTIELSSDDDDDDDDEDTVAKEKPIMMSCYSVATSDEEE